MHTRAWQTFFQSTEVERHCCAEMENFRTTATRCPVQYNSTWEMAKRSSERILKRQTVLERTIWGGSCGASSFLRRDKNLYHLNRQVMPCRWLTEIYDCNTTVNDGRFDQCVSPLSCFNESISSAREGK